ncbi:MAG: hypothetical protein HYW49_03600 [Deltaproteobacteria bacterium]|nr:hypothetical protein [Deltaproteobacteria bacterium]
MDKSNEASAVYEDRAVAFIDILGFKDLVARSDVPRLNELVEIFHKCFSVEGWKSLLQIDAIQFSDTIVVSAKLNSWADFARFHMKLGFGISNFHLSKHMTRGAVAYGKYFRRGDIIISPALISAYEYESKHAKHPRVLLTPEFLTATKTAIDASNDPAKSLIEHRLMTVPDLDGFQYLNYLPFYTAEPKADRSDGEDAFRDNRKRLAECLIRHKQAILESLATITKVDVRSKYIWLANYHNFFINSEKLDESLLIPENLLIL